MNNQALPTLSLLSIEQVDAIQETSLRILAKVGFKIQYPEVFQMLEGTPGVTVRPDTSTVQFSPELVMDSVAQTPKTYSLYGRDQTHCVTYGRGEMIFKNTPGDPFWADAETKTWRPPTIQDTRRGIDLADALPNINIVGAMADPADIPEPVRYICQMAELVKRTRKPIRTWVPDRASARYMVEILKTTVGGTDELRRHPMTEHSLEPISPLRVGTGLGAMLEFAEAGLPIMIGPIVQAMATGPVTLAGTVAQTIAEALACLVIVQRAKPGHPVCLAAACHIMDPRTMHTVYGGPEQGLLMAATTQVIKSLGLPATANAGYGDSKVPDVQVGLEKGMTLLMGALAGADSFGQMGVAGTLGASLLQLVVDDEMVGYVRRLMRGMALTDEDLAFDVIQRVGIGGDFLSDEHTVRHLRQEFWIPSLFDRHPHTQWLEAGGKTMLQRAREKLDRITDSHEPDWMEESRQREVDCIVAAAEKELLS